MKQGAMPEDGNQPQLRPKLDLLVIAYLFHLVVPALLLVDVVTTWLRRKITPESWGAETFVSGFAAAWLVAGLGALILSRDRPGFLRRIGKPLLAIYVTYMMLIFVEGFLRADLRLRPRFPHAELLGSRGVISVDPNVWPGVHGTKRFTINELGLRGPMPPKRGPAYKILAVGGSTTICPTLDDSEAWPQLLMDGMNAGQKSYPVWVGNAGVSGTNILQHLVLLQSLPGVLRADMLIFLVGVNDLAINLAFEGAPTEAFLESMSRSEKSAYPLYRRLQLFLLIRQAVRDMRHRFGNSGFERPFEPTKFRQQRAKLPIVPLPDLHTGLEEYRSRILALASRCRELESRCLFLTQPSMWRSDLSPAEQRLLWFGYVGRWDKPKGYGSAADLARAMDAYNRTLLDVCRQNGLECYDLAAHIPKDISAFSDDVHFNEAGSRLVAETLKEYLLSQPPFGTQPNSSGGGQRQAAVSGKRD
jgi:lysophospholipase L1-like esterase